MRMKTIPIQEWINARLELLGEKSDAGIAQACRFRNAAHALATSFEEYKNCAYVVGEHTSKSKRLPVVRYSTNGLNVVLRDNFYNVTMTVRGMKAQFDGQMMTLMNRICTHGFDTDVPECSFEGFPYVYKRKRYELNPKLFSLMVGTWEDAYTVMRVIGALQVGAAK